MLEDPLLKKSSADRWEGAGWMDKERKERSRCSRLHAVVVVSVGIIAVNFAFFNGCTGQKLLEVAMRASTNCRFFSNEHRYSLMFKPKTSNEYISR